MANTQYYMQAVSTNCNLFYKLLQAHCSSLIEPQKKERENITLQDAKFYYFVFLTSAALNHLNQYMNNLDAAHLRLRNCKCTFPSLSIFHL